MHNGGKNNNYGKQPVTLLQGDGLYFDRLLLRDSTIGTSSRIYYRTNSEGIPFQWERQPGTPKHPLENEVIPPLTPPPSVHSLRLPPRPKCVVEQSKEFKSKWKAWFWKIRSKKKNRDYNESLQWNDHVNNYEVRSDRFEREFMGSSFSSSSSSNRASLKSELGLRKDSMEGAFICSPWNIKAILVRVAKRV